MVGEAEIGQPFISDDIPFLFLGTMQFFEDLFQRGSKEFRRQWITLLPALLLPVWGNMIWRYVM